MKMSALKLFVPSIFSVVTKCIMKTTLSGSTHLCEETMIISCSHQFSASNCS
ncbi:hypothetical protein RND71_005413 [Anisodus tanguticus]|uniref:Uncharacterized protein n=1 Tax=Anisodus tanguticus TaxID=243964 RepID=A0AAE1SU43_9SOLA|nr:hypothetical protein RND71_005413 [Anisodus tanguticus]